MRRYIEIFRSSLNEVRGALNNPRLGGGMPGGGMGGGGRAFGGRPGPYDRNDRFGGGGMGGGVGVMGGRYGGPMRNKGRNNLFVDFENAFFMFQTLSFHLLASTLIMDDSFLSWWWRSLDGWRWNGRRCSRIRG